MDSLFLDTSFIIALEDADDQNHKAAASYWKTFKRNPRKIITTSTDCLSFLVMEEKEIKKALTFDEHFKQAGINN